MSEGCYQLKLSRKRTFHVYNILLIIFFSLLDTRRGYRIASALIGKFAVAGSFGLIYLYTAELFPTQVRNLGVGVTSIGARLGGMLSPVVLLLVSLPQ